jgi:hypothetical protein
MRWLEQSESGVRFRHFVEISNQVLHTGIHGDRGICVAIGIDVNQSGHRVQGTVASGALEGVANGFTDRTLLKHGVQERE